MWAENDVGSLGDTKIYEKVRIFFLKNSGMGGPQSVWRK